MLRFRASELYVDARRNRALLVEPRFDGQAGTMGRDATPVPFALYDSRTETSPRPFTERACADEPVLETGDQLMRLLFEIE